MTKSANHIRYGVSVNISRFQSLNVAKRRVRFPVPEFFLLLFRTSLQGLTKRVPRSG